MIAKCQFESGSSLIEVLVALLVFSVGMLGLAALQLNALRGVADSSQRSQSSWILQDIAERIRANPEGSAASYAAVPNCNALPAKMCADHYNPASSAKVAAANCNAAEMAAFDRWEAQCSYSAIASFNTISGRFSGRDFINTPEGGSTLEITNQNNLLTISALWLGKADAVKSGSDTTSKSTDLQVRR